RRQNQKKVTNPNNAEKKHPTITQIIAKKKNHKLYKKKIAGKGQPQNQKNTHAIKNKQPKSKNKKSTTKTTHTKPPQTN
ncbi:hypothetical protein ACQWJY_22090, partial [Salmonella enterica subsp. enterica serovar Infantis]